MRMQSWRTLEAGAVLLFALQAIRVIFAMLFAAIYDAMFDMQGMRMLLAGLGLLLVMLSMPALAPARTDTAPKGLLVTAVLAALVRTLLSVDIPLVRMAAAALTLGLAGAYVTSLLSTSASALAPALSLALVVDQLLRALGHTYDPSLRPGWGAVELVIALGVILLAERRLRRGQAGGSAYWGELEGSPPAESDRAGWAAGLALGAALFVFSSLLALPNAAARWTGASYAFMASALLATAMLPLSPWAARINAWARLEARPARLITALLLLAGLVAAYHLQGIPAALGMVIAAVALWLLLPASLAPRAEVRGARLGVALGYLALVLLSVLHALSFTYAYTVDLFRGLGLPAILLGAAIAVAPALCGSIGTLRPSAAPRGRVWPSLAAGAAIWLLATAWAVGPRTALAPAADTLRIATYNIHYGFNTQWNLSLEGQAQAIARSGADVVLMQEVDTGRLTSYGIDNALWLARRLGMEAVYLPTVEKTTGIALLTRLRLVESGGQLLPSEEEPTGIVRGTVLLGGEPLPVHGVWLGLSEAERARQLAAALDFIGSGRAVLGGDMNAEPDSAVYDGMLQAGFEDPFVASGFPPLFTDPAENPHKRIDYVWIRGLTATDAQVSDSLASDHRLVVIGVE